MTVETKHRFAILDVVYPDWDNYVEDARVRTDAPTCPQAAVQLICSVVVMRKRAVASFGCKALFLTGQAHAILIFVKPPNKLAVVVG